MGLFAPDAVINTWHVTLLDPGYLKTGLSLRVNAVFILGAVILLAVKFIQDGGILRSANTTKILGISAMIPLLLIGIVPILTGDIVKANLFPLAPLAHDAAGFVTAGSWNMAGITLFAAGMFIAGWSTYGFETAVCYTGEFKNPKTDTFKAIFYSGLLCVVVYTLVPFAFQGYLGLGRLVHPAVLDAAGHVTAPAEYTGMLAPNIYDGTGVAAVMARMVHAGQFIGVIVVIMLILALVLSLMTSMAGSSRTLYQASIDGWLPKYLAKVNAHGAPTNAMLTNLGFNLLLLLLSDTVFIIGAANIGYLIFNFLNLNAGWIHRLDRPRQERPWRAPTWILAAGAVLSFANLAFMGFGADVYGAGTLQAGLIFAALIVPVFVYRHYIQDKGSFPREMADDLQAVGAVQSFPGAPALLKQFRAILGRSLMGTRLYVAGPESFIGLVMKIALEFNLNKDEIRAEECGTLARRVYCIHCRATTENVRTNIVRCVGCDSWLLVRDHYSRRLAAYMGVMVDAEAPGELPEIKEVFV